MFLYRDRNGEFDHINVRPSDIMDARGFPSDSQRSWCDVAEAFGLSVATLDVVRESPEWRDRVEDYIEDRFAGWDSENILADFCKESLCAVEEDEPCEPEPRRFGIELEVVCKYDRYQVHGLLGASGVTCYVGYYDEANAGWKLGTDCTIQIPKSQSKRGYSETMEVVSPPLSGEDGMEEVREVTSVLRHIASTNETCGLHVHVDAGDLTLLQLKNVAKAWLRYQAVINYILPESRRGSENNYCRDNPTECSFEGVASDEDLFDRVSPSRYYKFNMQAYPRHGTLEFRYHGGAIKPKQVEMQILFCVGFVEYFKDVNVDIYEEGDAYLEDLLESIAPKSWRDGRAFKRYWRKRQQLYDAA